MTELVTILGQPSYPLVSDGARAYVTSLGGHLGPVTFRLGDREVSPYHVAPWAEGGASGEPTIIQVLRGDFFCLPFGGNDTSYGVEKYPVHGETANDEWTLEDISCDRLKMSLRTKIRPGKVTKEITLAGSTVYSRHTISEMSGPMSFGHHAMLRFQSKGLISTSPFAWGQVCPFAFEDAAKGGYSSLRQGARFDSLDHVSMADGGTADLSRYPAREGYEDLVMLLSEKDRDLAWTAVVFPDERYLWIGFKDPKVLTGTVLWHSNGGRHYAPWSSRHRAVLGLEEVTSYFHAGIAESVVDNELSRAGYRTFFDLDLATPLQINTIAAVAEIPEGFDHVADVTPTAKGILVRARSGLSVQIDADLGFLKGNSLA